MFNFNEVSSWISAMSDQEWTTVLGQASKLYKTSYAQFLKRKDNIPNRVYFHMQREVELHRGGVTGLTTLPNGKAFEVS